MGALIKDIIKRKLYILISAVVCILILMTALLCFFLVKREFETTDLNKLRTDVSALLSEIEATDETVFDADFSYAIIDVDGTVKYNSGTTLNGRVNVHSLGSSVSDFFTVPILKDDVINGILYVDISCGYYSGNGGIIALEIAISAVIIIVSLLIYLSTVSTLKKDVFSPIVQLHESTRCILNGQLDKTVTYDYDGEMGTMCHDFELMRCELLDSFNREQKMKDDEKLLMASISHDLKTPLATVQGYLESICLGVVTDSEDIKRYSKSAYDKTVLLGKITNDILEHSKAELRQLSVEPEEVYSAEYFGNLIELLKSDARSRGFTLTCNEIPNIILSLDKTRIAQVMENLVGNSFKYGKEKGKISISFNIQNNLFCVSVKDDGQGIAAEDLPFVFNRFFRGDKARTQSVSGSGLGLSIAKYIVERHGGTIECDSVLGCGTTVCFTLHI